MARIAAALSDLYCVLYEERPLEPQASLTGNMLAFVFRDGLSVADERSLIAGREDRLREFRRHFFDAISAQMVGVVGDLTGLGVNYSFYGFDPSSRTTHAIFVLDLAGLDGSEQRQAVLNWSDQVRRNAQRLRREHVAAREEHKELRARLRVEREALHRGLEQTRHQRPEDR